MFQPVIMAGGNGVRLWPLSRAELPKQFHALGGDGTLLQETVARLDGLGALPPLVVCNEAHRFVAAEQLRRIGREATFLLEPAGCGTAPAVALAALHAARDGGDPVLLALPADHAVADVAGLHRAIRAATPLAEAGRMVTFGIAPDRAETAYGYIRRGAPLKGGAGFAVAGFEEKPDRETAARHVAGGAHFWNSGMFMVKAERYLDELRRHRPDVMDACRAAAATISGDGTFLSVDAEAFATCPAVSIDHAIMERTDAAAVVPLDAGWSDIGSWAALWQALPRDEAGNALAGSALALDSRNTLVHATTRTVAVMGVDDLVVVETGDAVLVARRDALAGISRLADLAEEVRAALPKPPGSL